MDGTIQGKKYFDCDVNHGVLVSYEQVEFIDGLPHPTGQGRKKIRGKQQGAPLSGARAAPLPTARVPSTAMTTRAKASGTSSVKPTSSTKTSSTKAGPTHASRPIQAISSRTVSKGHPAQALDTKQTPSSSITAKTIRREAVPSTRSARPASLATSASNAHPSDAASTKSLPKNRATMSATARATTSTLYTPPQWGGEQTPIATFTDLPPSSSALRQSSKSVSISSSTRSSISSMPVVTETQAPASIKSLPTYGNTVKEEQINEREGQNVMGKMHAVTPVFVQRPKTLSRSSSLSSQPPDDGSAKLSEKLPTSISNVRVAPDVSSSITLEGKGDSRASITSSSSSVPKTPVLASGASGRAICPLCQKKVFFVDELEVAGTKFHKS